MFSTVIYILSTFDWWTAKVICTVWKSGLRKFTWLCLWILWSSGIKKKWFGLLCSTIQISLFYCIHLIVPSVLKSHPVKNVSFTYNHLISWINFIFFQWTVHSTQSCTQANDLSVQCLTGYTLIKIKKGITQNSPYKDTIGKDYSMNICTQW